MDVLVLSNPRAGRSRGVPAAERVEARLVAAGHGVVRCTSERPGHVTELADERGRDARVVVVVGGDGTLREAAKGLLRHPRRPRLAFVPLGNANVVARQFGIPRDVEAAADLVDAGSPCSIDVLETDRGEPALAMIGVGYDATVARWLGALRAKPFFRSWYRLAGDTLYGVLGAAALFQPFQTRVRARLDGNRLAARASAAVVCNLETYAKGWAVTPGAVADDGQLDLFLRKSAFPPFAAATLVAALLRARAPRWLADYGSGRTLVLEAEGGRRMRWQADGDPMGETERLEIRVTGAALELYVPPEEVGPPEAALPA